MCSVGHGGKFKPDPPVELWMRAVDEEEGLRERCCAIADLLAEGKLHASAD